MLKRLIILAITVLVICVWPASTWAAPSVDDCMNNNNEECNTDSEQPGTGEDGADEQNQSGEVEEPSSNLFFYFVKLFFALAFVLALIYFLLKFLNRRNKMFQKVRAMENVGGISLGSQKSLQIVRIGEKVYVIGVGDNVEMLTEITDEKTKTELLNNDGGAEFRPVNLLTSVLSKNKKTAEAGEEKQTNNNFSQLFQTELDRLKQGRKQLIERRQNKDENSNE
ncbi:flagellar biosynthetic protein FliO [Sediminibacillus albus]|uniref:Flagellar protein n=1 Tax=Sediminibacillus albus TaxID=407036 RepID=A0A1G8W1K3_9BACI|nr:flagellar biosynthetic protein FliO [Sediminibacillus albus]SDJ72202.1 flagellar protein FliO/FliZ [Sediminibacillus albus]